MGCSATHPLSMDNNSWTHFAARSPQHVDTLWTTARSITERWEVPLRGGSLNDPTPCWPSNALSFCSLGALAPEMARIELPACGWPRALKMRSRDIWMLSELPHRRPARYNTPTPNTEGKHQGEASGGAGQDPHTEVLAARMLKPEMSDFLRNLGRRPIQPRQCSMHSRCCHELL